MQFSINQLNFLNIKFQYEFQYTQLIYLSSTSTLHQSYCLKTLGQV